MLDNFAPDRLHCKCSNSNCYCEGSSDVIFQRYVLNAFETVLSQPFSILSLLWLDDQFGKDLYLFCISTNYNLSANLLFEAC